MIHFTMGGAHIDSIWIGDVWIISPRPTALHLQHHPGVSMGGTVAAAAALLASPHGTARGPAVVPCVGTWSAETFVRGVLRKRIAWEALAIDSHEGPRYATPRLPVRAGGDSSCVLCSWLTMYPPLAASSNQGVELGGLLAATMKTRRTTRPSAPH